VQLSDYEFSHRGLGQTQSVVVEKEPLNEGEFGQCRCCTRRQVIIRLTKIRIISVLLLDFSESRNPHGEGSKQLLLPAKGIGYLVLCSRLVLKHEGKLLQEINPPGMADVEVLLGVYVA